MQPSERLSWLFEPPATKQALDALRAAVPSLPESYLRLLGQGNGGETDVGFPPYLFCLESAESALDYWQSGAYTMQDVFVFGGTGGLSLFALDMRQEPRPVILFDPIDPPGSLKTIAPTFDAFLTWVSRDVDV